MAKLFYFSEGRLVFSVVGLLVCAFVFFLFLHDYIFLFMEYRLGSTYGLNLWKEMVCVAYVALLFLTILFTGKVQKFNAVFMLVLVLLFVLLLFFGDFSVAALRTFRSLFTPFVFAVLIGYLVQGDLFRRSNFFYGQLQFVLWLACLYGLYQLYFISVWADFWYFEPLVSMGFELKEYNSFREGAPRISGFFTSSLEFSFFLVFCFFINFSYFFNACKEKRFGVGVKEVASFILLVFIAFLVFSSTVRSAQICLITGFALVLFLTQVRRRFWIILSGFLYVLSLTLATFIYIGLGYTDDLSALGRLVQWRFILNQTLSNPLGFGFSSVGPGQFLWFDSLWLNLASCVGVLSLGVFFGLIYCYLKTVDAYVYLRGSRNCRVKDFSLAVIVIFPIFLYAAFFQAFYNSTALYLLLMMVSIVLRGVRYAKY